MAGKYAVQKNQEFADINDIDTDLPDEEREDAGDFTYSKLSEAQKAKWRECFEYYDKDKNGRIDKKEIINALRVAGLSPTKKDADRIMKQLDENGNGFIDWEEFKQLLARSWGSCKQNELELVASFRMFDVNEDGFISKEELRNALMMLGEQMSEDEVDSILKMADTDGDGRINYKEFAHILTTDP